MSISEADYKNIIRSLKRMVPDFHYSRHIDEEEGKSCLGLYDPEVDKIFFHKPQFYSSQRELLRVGLHELAHWSLSLGAKRAKGLPNKYSNVSENVEEVIAESVAKRICLDLGMKRYTDNWYIARYRRRLRRSTNKKYYRQLSQYIDRKVDEVVSFIRNYSS